MQIRKWYCGSLKLAFQLFLPTCIFLRLLTISIGEFTGPFRVKSAQFGEDREFVQVWMSKRLVAIEVRVLSFAVGHSRVRFLVDIR